MMMCIEISVQPSFLAHCTLVRNSAIGAVCLGNAKCKRGTICATSEHRFRVDCDFGGAFAFRQEVEKGRRAAREGRLLDHDEVSSRMNERDSR